MSLHFRNAIKQVKECYINKLVKAGIYKEADRQLYHLTLTELHSMTKKIRTK
ncbi:Fur-regulated basic protein FbpA [Peribacillus sp. SCS-155]|uniref:Fur-regulated basic protein FbpA n=1 Tax=Peribacillus sedimenti TaxID=3115297 RepID=UPI003905F964